MKEIYLAGGCFWGVEKYFAMLLGVKETMVGYANGVTQNPTYEQVCHEDTGHAEAVKVVYDENRISLLDILLAYFKVIDPISLNKQGPDVGEQYRTGIYYTTMADEEIIVGALQELQKQYNQPIVVETKPLLAFYKAEEHHQQYLDKNPNGYCHIPANLLKSKK